ncbi:unnamed protein product [Schistocephalus solidus]|uniref:Zf-CCHC_4 domain-containing protein n=1 Tax=Schistocephalus solidus TaxID=70667 RepID=A0A183TTM8_SCHSO|nr:unnamed protein product [Schistocephalus solidus]
MTHCHATQESTTRLMIESPKLTRAYNGVVLMTILCGGEACTVYSNRDRKLNHFHLNCLRKILKLRELQMNGYPNDYSTEMSLWVLADNEDKNYAKMTYKDLDHVSLAWRISVKTGAAIYEANLIAAKKAKRSDRNSQVPRVQTFNAQGPSHPHVAHAYSTREFASSDIFKRNAATTR